MKPASKAPESVARIHDVGFYSLNSSAWDDLATYPDGLSSDQSSDFNLRSDYPSQTSSPSNGPVFEHPCAPLTKILSSGTFYYALSPQWDISSRLSRRVLQANGESVTYDNRFLWNAFIVRSLLDFRENLDQGEREEIDRCQFIVSVDVLLICSCHDVHFRF